MASTAIEERKAQKRRRILHAAIKIFARRGFYNAKIAEIAREAGVADGTVYLYFRNKDDLLISVFEEAVGEVIARFREKLYALSDPREKIRQLVLLHLNIVETNPDLATVLQLEIRQSNKFIKEYAGTSFNDYLSLIADIVEEGQRSRTFRSDINTGIAKRMLFGALDEISTLWVLAKEKKHDVRESAEQIASIFLDGMLVDPAGGKSSAAT